MDSDREAAAELLERAADGFESGRYYWTKGRYHRVVFGTHAYCSMGALAHENGQADRALGHRTVPVEFAAKALAGQVNPYSHLMGGDVVVRWNDGIHPLHARSKADVIEAMKQAAKDLRNG